MMPMRRVYYFTPPKHALDNLKRSHLKVARFSQCNDPFELAAFSQRNKRFRQKFQNWLSQMDKSHGLLCFCRSWRNPVMWAHYAENHTGVCYGFDVDPKTFIDVRYVSERLYPNITPENFLEQIGEQQMVDLFATKYIHWSYEEEVRLLVNFREAVVKDQPVFHEFSGSMQLREVIVGPRSNIRVSDIVAEVADKEVEIFKARIAFQRFEVVRQKNKAKW